MRWRDGASERCAERQGPRAEAGPSDVRRWEDPIPLVMGQGTQRVQVSEVWSGWEKGRQVPTTVRGGSRVAQVFPQKRRAHDGGWWGEGVRAGFSYDASIS